jgi:hypothetical protein
MKEQLNNPNQKTTRKVQQTHTDIVAEAIKQRDQFLQQRPQMRSYQREIDRILDKAGDSESRMAVLSLLMEGKLAELRKSLGQLNNLVADLSG